MEEDEPSELKNATGKKKAFNGPVDDEEDAAQLWKFYLEIKTDNLSAPTVSIPVSMN
jgi:hypothetical protein